MREKTIEIVELIFDVIEDLPFIIKGTVMYLPLYPMLIKKGINPFHTRATELKDKLSDEEKEKLIKYSEPSAKEPLREFLFRD